MAEATAVERALADVAGKLHAAGRAFALVGGLAVSVRGEVRFTRDVDLAVQVLDDRDAEQLVHQLKADGFHPVATVEHEQRRRLSTVRLLSPQGVKVDLLFASCGIEREVVERSSAVDLPHAGPVPVAAAEELLAMKVLSMTGSRLQDRLDAQRLLACNPDVDLARVRDDLSLIVERGYDRGENLAGKLADLLASR